MGFLLIIVAVLFLLPIILPPPSTGYTGKNEKSWCPPHKWDYNAAGFLQCTVCNKHPGYEGRE